MSGPRPPARLAWALALVLVHGVAAAEPAPSPAGAPNGVRSERLANGLRVILAPDTLAAAVDVSVWYAAGLRAEKPGQRGIAHLFEHLMFDGSAHVPRRGHQARIDSLGGNAGAVTTADGIEFFDTVPASGLGTALALEADRMTGLTLDAGRLEGERAAVKLERQQPAVSSPLVVGLRLATETAYGDHPYHSAVMGSDAELAKLTVADLLAWYRARYGPREAVLTIVGRFDPMEAMALVHARFDALHGGEPAPTTPKPVAPTAARRQWVRTALPYGLVVIGWPGPGRGDPDATSLAVLAALLARGDGSPLANQLIEQQKLGFFVSGDVDARRDASLFTLTVGVQPGADSAAVERALTHAVEQVAAAPPADAELARARRQLENAMLFGWQSARGRGQAIGSAVAMGADADDPAQQLERLRRVSAADLQRVAARWLTAPRRSVVWLAARVPDAAGSGGAR